MIKRWWDEIVVYRGEIVLYILLPLGVLSLFAASMFLCARAIRENELNKPVSIVNVYNTNGKLIRSLKGTVDADTSNGSKVIVTVDGKKYVFYGCVIETIEQ